MLFRSGEVSIAELLAREYPSVPFVIPHLGSFADDWKAQLAFIDHLARHPNVYTDTSGIRRFDLLEQAVTRAGAGKLLFGSDGPWLHPGVELAKVRALGLSDADEQRVLARNFLALIARVRRRPDVTISRGPDGPAWTARSGDARDDLADPWRPQEPLVK